MRLLLTRTDLIRQLGKPVSLPNLFWGLLHIEWVKMGQEEL